MSTNIERIRFVVSNQPVQEFGVHEWRQAFHRLINASVAHGRGMVGLEFILEAGTVRIASERHGERFHTHRPEKLARNPIFADADQTRTQSAFGSAKHDATVMAMLTFVEDDSFDNLLIGQHSNDTIWLRKNRQNNSLVIG